MPRSTEQVITDHAGAMARGDLDAILADYSADAVFVTPDGAGSGPAEIRQRYISLLPYLDGLAFRRNSVHIDGPVLYSTWTASAGPRTMVGSDSFVVTGGLISVHTAFFVKTGVT